MKLRPFIVIAIAGVALALGSADARAVATPITTGLASVPPIAVLTPAADNRPPATSISDPIEPTATCRGWHLQSD